MTGKVLHIKNLEKYHPGYKDRHLIWFKLYFSMLDGDDEFEMLDEIDKWRFVSFTILELKNKKPILLDEKYLIRKGFDFKKKKLEDTLIALSPFVEVCNMGVTENHIPVTQIRLDYNRIEKNIIDKYMCEFEEFWKIYPARNGRKLEKEVTLKMFQGLTQDDVKNILVAVKNYADSYNTKQGIGIRDPKRFLGNGFWKEWLEPEVVNVIKTAEINQSQKVKAKPMTDVEKADVQARLKKMGNKFGADRFLK